MAKIWSKLFWLDNDLYVVIAYIPPQSSTYYVENSDLDHFDIPSTEIEPYASLGNPGIIRDLNSRIGLRKESHYDVRSDSQQWAAGQVRTDMSMDMAENSWLFWMITIF